MIDKIYGWLMDEQIEKTVFVVFMIFYGVVIAATLGIIGYGLVRKIL